MVLPAVTIAVSLILIGRRALNESIYIEQSETASRIADRIQIHIDHVGSVLSLASTEPGLPAFTRTRQEESLKRLLRWQSTFKEAFLLNSSGQETAKIVSVSNRFVSSPALISRANRSEFSVPAKEGRTYISPPFFGGDRLPYILVSVPTYGRKAVLVAKVTLKDLWDLIEKVREGKPGMAYVIDSKGNLIAHPDRQRVQMHTNLDDLSIVRSFQSGKIGHDSFGLHRDERNEKVVSLVQVVPTLGWGVVMEIPMEFAYASIRMMQKQVLQWTLICVFLILVLAFWRVRQIVKPIEILRAGAEKISQGKLNLKLDIHTGDELEHLSCSFEKMAQSLKELEELRRDLISMIVHDLKSPLSGVIGGIDYVLEHSATANSETSIRVLSLARKSSDDLYQMIQNLLDVAKMEEGKVELHREPVSVSELLTDSIRHFQVQADKEDKSLKVSIDEEVPSVSIDVQLIRRVLHNLISNAIRHTTSGGNITLRAALMDQFIEVTVEDDGEGIPSEYQDKIFDKFVQAERKRVHLRTGTGLGLTFCKMAIELHEGKISVHSESGKGSAFKFTLPFEKIPETLTAETESAPVGSI